MSKHDDEHAGAGFTPKTDKTFYEMSQPDAIGTAKERAYFPALLEGLGIASRHFFRNFFFGRDANVDVLARKGPNTITTVQYPEEQTVYPPGYRSMHRLVPREDGK